MAFDISLVRIVCIIHPLTGEKALKCIKTLFVCIPDKWLKCIVIGSILLIGLLLQTSILLFFVVVLFKNIYIFIISKQSIKLKHGKASNNLVVALTDLNDWRSNPISLAKIAKIYIHYHPFSTLILEWLHCYVNEILIIFLWKIF